MEEQLTIVTCFPFHHAHRKHETKRNCTRVGIGDR